MMMILHFGAESFFIKLLMLIRRLLNNIIYEMNKLLGKMAKSGPVLQGTLVFICVHFAYRVSFQRGTEILHQFPGGLIGETVLPLPM